MSVAYKKRKKAIRDEKLRRGTDALSFGRIPPKEFSMMQADWERGITGPPIGTLADFAHG